MAMHPPRREIAGPDHPWLLAAAALALAACGTSSQDTPDPDSGTCASLPPEERILKDLLRRGITDRELIIALGFDDPSAMVVAWPAAEDYVSVSCAVFACVPLFEDNEISNAAECILRYASFPATAATGDLDASGRPPPTPPDTTAPATIDPATSPAAILRVGCWAYGETQIVAASKLAPLPPEQAMKVISKAQRAKDPFFAAYTDDCADNDGKWCDFSDAPDRRSIGTCQGGACRMRCTVEASGSADAGPPDPCTTDDSAAETTPTDPTTSDTSCPTAPTGPTCVATDPAGCFGVLVPPGDRLLDASSPT